MPSSTELGHSAGDEGRTWLLLTVLSAIQRWLTLWFAVVVAPHRLTSHRIWQIGPLSFNLNRNTNLASVLSTCGVPFCRPPALYAPISLRTGEESQFSFVFGCLIRIHSFQIGPSLSFYGSRKRSVAPHTVDGTCYNESQKKSTLLPKVVVESFY